MHEVSLCESVLRILEDNASSQGYSRVRTVWLEVGDLAGVELSALRFGFDAVMHGSLADGARLEIIERPGEALCLSCGKPVRIRQRHDACPACGGYPLQVTGGEQMRIKELEVE